MARLPVELSPPCVVHFAGWRSDTYTLQRAGWDIAVEPDRRHDRLRMLLHFKPCRIVATASSRDLYSRVSMRLPEFEVNQLSTDMIVHLHSVFRQMRWIDATPEVIQVEEGSIYRLPLFAELEKPRAEELIVEPQDVQALLDKIRVMQSPAQAEIRQRQQRRERETRRQMHAHIITLAAA